MLDENGELKQTAKQSLESIRQKLQMKGSSGTLGGVNHLAGKNIVASEYIQETEK